MGEKVIVRQKADYTVEVFASDPENEESIETHPVDMLFDLSPYGMLLLSIGTCTTILLLSYAQNHKFDLQTVEICLEYQRKFKEDCEHCEEIKEYTEQIQKEILFTGKLTQAQQERLLAISHQCPVSRMVEDGVVMETRLAAPADQ